VPGIYPAFAYGILRTAPNRGDKEIERIYPPGIGSEREMLAAWLDFHRVTLKMKCEGLDADQLRLRSVEPSALSLLGLVRHMAEVERFWFAITLVGDDAPPVWSSEPASDFDADGVEVDDAFQHWYEECSRARTIVAEAETLDVIAAKEAYGRAVSLRWILNHMIEEYARHNGHADMLRERIDGSTGD
jgi:uncharacterized damage-inducible protein DinB